MSDVVGTSINNEPFSALDISKTPCNAQEQEVNELYHLLKLERNRYNQCKLLYDVLEESDSESSDMDPALKMKVIDIILSVNVTQNLTLDECKPSESTACLLGLSNVDKQELTYAERYELAEILRLRLNHKYESVCDEFRKVTDRDIEKTLENTETMPLEMPAEDKVLIEYKSKLLSEQEIYVKNLLSLLELLTEITNLRLKKLPEVTEQKIKECQIEEKMNYLKSTLAQEKVRIDVFTETSTSLKAYKELIRDIKDQQKEYEKEVQELRDLKEKYKQVSCKQYDNILKSYLQYKSSIEKKKLLYDCLKT